MGIKGKTKSDLIKMKRVLLEDIAGLKEALGMVQNSLFATLSIKATIKQKRKALSQQMVDF